MNRSAAPIRRRRLALAALLSLAALGTLVALFARQSNGIAQAPTARTPTLVRAAKAELHDAPVYLRALGTVQALTSVQIKSRVDGAVARVAFREGDEVHAGDLLLEIDPRPYAVQIDIAEAQAARDRAALAAAEADLGRLQELVARGIRSQQALDQQRATVGQLHAAIKGDEAQIANARLQLSYATIHAPLTGQIGLRMVDQGNIVRAADSTVLAVVNQIEPIAMVFSVPQDRLRTIQANQAKAPLSVRAYSSEGTTLLDEGALIAAENQIDASTGTVKLKALFANHQRALWPGQFVAVSLVVETRANVVTVPAPAINRGIDGTFVYIVDDQAKAMVRAVEIGQVADGRALVESGLAAGEMVVTAGQEKLFPGAAVTVASGDAA